MAPLKIDGREAVLNKYVLSFLWKMAIISEDLIVIGVDSQLLAQPQRKHVYQNWVKI